ncbi:MAG: extracellular solute-binding protein [Elainellaceae cyanobacterium]
MSQHIPFSRERRSLLLGLLALALGACRADSAPLTVYLLEGAVPAALLKAFGRQQSDAVQLKSRPQLLDLFKVLQQVASADSADSDSETDEDAAKAAASPKATIISLGDYWLAAAIQNRLIRPLPLRQVVGWSSLPKAWRQLVTRDASGNPDENGQVWAAPYRTGSLVIAYRRAELAAQGPPPTDWQDLWRDELAGKISMLDSDRAVIGVVLKALGRDPNTPDLAAVDDLEARLTALHRNVRLYSSNAYLQPLILGEVNVAVGWSTDILPLVRRNQRLAVAIPESGTLMTSDLWVQPAAPDRGPSNGDLSEGTLSALTEQWISFFWQPEVAQRLSLLNAGISPILLEQAREALPPALRADAALLPSRQIVDRSSPLLPLPPSAAAAYRQLWASTRRSVSAAQGRGIFKIPS